MNRFASICPRIFLGVLLLVVLGAPVAVHGQASKNWKAVVGGQNANKAHQAMAFLPNEMWIHAGDSITWTAEADEIHTVTFLTAAQTYPSFQVGCPGYSGNTATFDGSSCVSTPPLPKGAEFTVTFPKPGNFKLVCLVHTTMNGAIHVLSSDMPLPHDQAFYDEQAEVQLKELIAESHSRMDHDMDQDDSVYVRVLTHNQVTAGVGEVAATPGGLQGAALMRFLKGTIQIHKGETVEWSNSDPEEPHTITFGTEPANTFLPSSNVTVDADGARHATISSHNDNVHSGFIQAAAFDEQGVLPQNPLNFTRFRVTFTEPGTYDYICALHDNLGMKGKVIVLP